ncbi:MAG: aldose 1-epimerase family protein [Flavobacteriales bacterium]|nr:aldose 1-epimerase family protein [Flavobacteriales bacterium]
MTDTYHIFSGDYKVSFYSKGAELNSFQHLPTSTEFIWQAGPLWPRHAPVLFPFVGRLKNFQYRFDNQNFTIEQHGFARDMVFKAEPLSDNSIQFVLTPDAYTRLRFPFEFELNLVYTLVDNELFTEFIIKNWDDIQMPFSFGGHPAFNIPDLENTYLQFSEEEALNSLALKDNFISDRQVDVSDAPGRINITEFTFLKDALIFKGLRSDMVSIRNTKNSYRVEVNFKEWPYLGIWSKPSAFFTCIEPWYGLADHLNFKGDVRDKEGILLLLPGQEFKRSYRIKVFH